MQFTARSILYVDYKPCKQCRRRRGSLTGSPAMERALCVYVQHLNMHTHLKRHQPGVTISVAVEKKTSFANPGHDTISTTAVWEFRNANTITKFIGVFIAADLLTNKQLKKKFPLTVNRTVLYRTVTSKPRYVPNRDFCVPLHP